MAGEVKIHYLVDVCQTGDRFASMHNLELPDRPVKLTPLGQYSFNNNVP